MASLGLYPVLEYRVWDGGCGVVWVVLSSCLGLNKLVYYNGFTWFVVLMYFMMEFYSLIIMDVRKWNVMRE